MPYGTVKTYLAAIRYLQNFNEFARAQISFDAQAGVGGERNSSPQSMTRPRLPITPVILHQIKALWSREANDYDTIMLWAACCTAFFGFFRMGEVTSPTTDGRSLGHCVSVADVAIDNAHNPSVIRIKLHSSKTDQFSQGVNIFLGRTGLDLCPVSALLAYLAVRGSEPGPLFKLSDGLGVTSL